MESNITDSTFLQRENKASFKSRSNDVVDAATFPTHFAEIQIGTGQSFTRDASSTHSGSETPPIVTYLTSACPIYDMRYENPGKVIVFNHFEFENGSKRDGTNKDVERIEKTFKCLKFNVTVHNDLKLAQIRETINKLQAADYSNDSCLIIFILTHGYREGFVKAKDEAYALDSIWEKFTADNCKQLAGKPKLFFFQVCRGRKFDPGVRMPSMSVTDSSNVSYKIPSHADFLIGNSTFDDYVSWRNPEEGSWYIKVLCNVLDNYSETEDLLSMMTIVARKVGTEFITDSDEESEANKVQMPTVLHTLMRKIYLKPQALSYK